MNATVSFLEGTLSLIHIPLDLYSIFLQPILKVLLPPSQGGAESPTALTFDGVRHRHGFLNISVTPIECSIVCNSVWAESVFKPAIQRLTKDQARTVAISKDTYAVLSVLTAGLDAGSRVADLTSPLALAGIPLFFITTYYCDFILVPTKDRQDVVKTLLAKGFVFSEDDQSRLVSPLPSNPAPTAYAYPSRPYYPTPGGPGRSHHSRATSHGSSPFSGADTPPAPGGTSSPPSPTDSSTTIDALQQRTFALLKTRHITPRIIPNLTLVQCTGIRGAGITPPSTRAARSHHHHHHHHHKINNNNNSSSNNSNPTATGTAATTTCWVDTIDTKLYTAVVSALVAQPRFLSLTLAHEDPPSLLLDRRLLGLFGAALIGPITIADGDGLGGRRRDGRPGGGGEEEDEGGEGEEGGLVPVFLDLADLPFEATGIVSGVAGRLVKEMEMGPASAPATPTNPAVTKASRAAWLISANRRGPSFCPPYHRVTMTMVSHRSMSCIRCSKRPPAAVSPSSSQSWKLVPPGPRMRHAVMLWWAVRTRLSLAIRCCTYAAACAGECTGAQRATKVDLHSEKGADSVQGGDLADGISDERQVAGCGAALPCCAGAVGAENDGRDVWVGWRESQAERGRVAGKGEDEDCGVLVLRGVGQGVVAVDGVDGFYFIK
ncbi:hypothetical protein BT67DRAFT_431804 [Trichocladium antarcticum]|uniref:CASTOR ACT domain-containing protein n=1 Tax=Trichocladium antarcticum TaxID=1450529 RepID=A0AAN6UTD6_9PEZI|nr:hypothetical protein BT67DRAFT_431804 [Trichocladium antarcticum]